MNDEKQTEVLIEREGRTWRWGESAYLKTWNGLKQTVSQAALKAIALPLAIILAALTFFFSARKEREDSRGKEIPIQNIAIEIPVIESKILSELPNTITRQRVGTGVVGRIKVFNLRSLMQVPVGSEAKAILESGATNGIVKARLTSALMVDGEPIIPENAVVFGHGMSTEERLFVEFQKVIFANGESFSIRAQAFDVADKILGLKGSLVGTKTRKMGMALGFGLLGGMADGLQDTSGSSMWGLQQKKSIRDAALSGASKAAIDQSKAYIEDMKNAPNIIEVKKGTEFYLIIDEPKREDNKNE